MGGVSGMGGCVVKLSHRFREATHVVRAGDEDGGGWRMVTKYFILLFGSDLCRSYRRRGRAGARGDGGGGGGEMFRFFLHYSKRFPFKPVSEYQPDFEKRQFQDLVELSNDKSARGYRDIINLHCAGY